MRTYVSAGIGRLAINLSWTACLSAALLLAGLSGPARAVPVEDFQKAVDSYLAERKQPEHITGVSAFVSLGHQGPDIQLFAGTTSEDDGAPVSGDTLFQIGSNTKGSSPA